MNEKVSTKNLSSIELSIRTVKPRTASTGANAARTEQPEGARVVVVTSY
jgi:hypothetical protein